MALPTSGVLSFNAINTELGKGATSAISLNDAAVRKLAGKSSGAISFADLRGKSSVAPPAISWRRVYSDNGYEIQWDYNVSGDSVTTSGTFTSGGSYISASKISNTRYRFRATRSFRSLSGTYRVTATNSAGSASTSRALTMYYDDGSQGCCFTGDSLVTMADGSYKRIDEVVPGDWVKTPFGISEVDWIRLPKLQDRPLLAMDGGRCKTSGEHSIWTMDEATGDQWWSTRNMTRWLYESENGEGPGLNGKVPWDLEALGKTKATFATETGWVKTGWSVVEDAPFDTQLYHLYLKDHASYFVDGILVIGELPRKESMIDWTRFRWNPRYPQRAAYMSYDYELPPLTIVKPGLRIVFEDEEDHELPLLD